MPIIAGSKVFVSGGISTMAVSSVFGRTAAVVAVTGDYTVAQVTGAAPLVVGVEPASLPSTPVPNNTLGEIDQYMFTALTSSTWIGEWVTSNPTVVSGSTALLARVVF